MSRFFPISNYLYRCNNRNMPQAYDDSLSFQELIYQTIKKLNECIDYVNTWTELANELDKALAEFDEKVKNEVKTIIQAMYESGELKAIIQEVVEQAIEELPREENASVLDPTRIARAITKAVPEGDTTFTTEDYAFPQGCTTFKVNNIRYYVVALLPANNFTGDTVRVNCYQQTSENYLTMIGSAVYDGLGHANGLCFYSADDSSFSVLVSASQGNLLNDVIKLSFNYNTNTWSSLTEAKTVVNPNISYIGCIAYHNNKNYLLCNNNNIFEYDFSNNTVNFVCQLDFNANISNAGLSVTDDYIYIANSITNSVIKADFQGKTVWRYNIPVVANGGMYLFGELESITIEDDMLYAFTGYTLQPLYYNNYVKVQFWKQNLKTNGVQPTVTGNQILNGASYRYTFYVQGDLPTSLDDASNPTGLSYEDAFSTVQEAIDFGKWCDVVKTIRVNINNHFNTSTLFIDTEKPIFLTGEKYYEDHKNATQFEDKYAIIGAVINVNCTNLMMKRLGFENRVANIANTSSSYKNSCIYCLNSVLNITSPYFPAGTGSNPSYTLNAISLNGGFCNYYKDSIDGGTSEAGWQGSLTNRKFINGAGCTVNGHGDLTLNINVIG